MGIFTALARTFDSHSPTRPDFAEKSLESGHEATDDQGLLQAGDDVHFDHDLAGMTMGLEYADSDGTVSRRWVTIEAAADNLDGHQMIVCHCFMRKGLRSFRVDRVINIFDEHGETFDVRDVLHLKVHPTKAKIGGGAYRSVCRDGLRVLIAVARVDGQLDPAEVTAIMDYAREEGERLGVVKDDSTLEGLLGYVKRLQPSRSVIQSCLKRLETTDAETKQALVRYLSKVVMADGVMDPAESELVDAIISRFA